MYKEYNVVMAKRNLSHNVLKGYIGTIVLVYQRPSLAYEVEFVDSKGDTIELLTIQPTDIVLVGSEPI